jgi:hypothetical protein
MIIVDAGTPHKHGAYLADKSDSLTLEAFDIFCSQAETTTGGKIHQLQMDGAFNTNAWKAYCQKKGIVNEFMVPYSSAQNGLAE